MQGHFLQCPSVTGLQESLESLTLDDGSEEEVAALLTVTCRNPGCGELIDTDCISQHEAQCDYGLEECRNKGCEQEVARIEMEKHRARCDFAEVQCEHPGCGDYVLRRRAASGNL